MTKISIAPADWVVVCDGRKWLILENKGDAELVNLVVREHRETENPPTHVQGTERPGRTRRPAGTGGAAVGQTDWHEQAEQTFLKLLAERLNAAAQAGEFPGMILVAPPRAMGMIRPRLSAATAELVRGHLEKDYAMLPVDQIEKHLADRQ